MCKAIGYIRVSTEEQVKHGSGLEIQINEIKEYCKKNNIELLHVFEDAGVSGANDVAKRKGLNNLFDYCKENRVNKVIITKMDRLARDLYIQLWIEKELKIYDIEVLSINEDNLNGDDYMTKAMRQMVGVFAELEKNRISDRLLRGRRTKANKGIKASGNTPIGYRYQYSEQGKNPVVVIDAQKAEIVKKIFSSYLKGYSLQKIANELNRKFITTERGNEWSKQTIQKILRNDFYTGVLRFDNIEGQGTHEPIISKIVFGKVQVKLSNSRKNRVDFV